MSDVPSTVSDTAASEIIVHIDGDIEREANILRDRMRRDDMYAARFEELFVPRPAYMEVRNDPHVNGYDRELLIIAEDWSMSLSSLSRYENSNVSAISIHGRFAFTRLNHVIRTCHNIVYREYKYGLNPFGNANVEHSRYIGGPDVPRDVIAARLVICGLLSVDFGLWLETTYEDRFASFSRHRLSFTVDFCAMKITQATIDENGRCRRRRMNLLIHDLFPYGGRPREFLGSRLKSKHQRIPLPLVGAWYDINVEYDDSGFSDFSDFSEAEGEIWQVGEGGDDDITPTDLMSLGSWEE
ncbi:hypothetical protein ONZ43_g4989 [Nemania bipapillata]|uniref:Uncharacterized protein n=1 Tax=Nemania bipapillata TaxID=110536 RepID=A0ACC2IG03_9PEZI|nr:hypothetical protein ONZ43_g4989 [Nemania bipapillata]